MSVIDGERRQRRKIRVCIPSVRRTGGGNEVAAAALVAALELDPDFEVQALVLDEAAATLPAVGQPLARFLTGRRINLLYFLLPYFLGRTLPDCLVLMHGNANLLLPYFRWRKVGTILVCDSPPRQHVGWKRWLEHLRWKCAGRATKVVATFAMTLPCEATVIENPVTLPIAGPQAFGREPIRDLLYVGRLSDEKGIMGFLQLARQMPEYRFLVYGSGFREPQVCQIADQHPNVCFHGFAHDWWRRHSSGACLVGCSRVEGCWTTGAEALLAGIPTIAVESESGGPQALALQSSMAQIICSLDADEVRGAIDQLAGKQRNQERAADTLAFRLDRARITRDYGRLVRDAVGLTRG